MNPTWQSADGTASLYLGDALTVLRTLPAESVNCCITSPPYWGLRDYGIAGQLGLEPTPEEYVASMVDVFQEVRIESVANAHPLFEPAPLTQGRLCE